MSQVMIEKTCRSCGTSWVLDPEVEADEVSNCRSCREAFRFVDEGLRFLRPKTAAAKRLLQAVNSAQALGKFASAKELMTQLIEQISQDRFEHEDRKERDRFKKERWAARQGDRRNEDRARSKSGKR